MSIREPHNLGDKVWVYQTGHTPFVGTVSQVRALDMDCYRVDSPERREKDRVYTAYSLWPYPAGRERLVAQMLDDASDLEAAAQSLSRRAGDG